MAEAAALGADTVGVARRVRAIVAGSLGNLVEWYDFYAYSFTSLYFAAAFFPKGDRTSQLLQTAAIFAVGFLMRPLGGWFFGRFADRQGRRASMLLSVLLMCAGSLMIGFLPTHAQVGALAPALLLVARLIQGFSVGGEYGTSATYMSEVALSGRRGFFASFQYVTLIGGQLTAVVLLLPLQHFLGEEALRAWGWRIPFWVGAALALITLYLRRHLPETAPPEKRKAEAGTMGALLKHKRALLIVFGLTAAGSLSFYTFTTYMQKYLVNTAGLPAATASTVMTGALFLFMLAQPAFGALSDRVGRRVMLIGFGALSALCTWPILATLAGVGGAVPAFLLVMAALLITSLYTSISGLIKAELFPIEVRALGVGLAYGLANALFGGTAEYVALWFKDLGHETWFYAYVTALCVLGLVTALNMHETFKTSALEED